MAPCELAARIAKVEPWNSTQYSQKGWRFIIALAKDMSKMRPKDIEMGLEMYAANNRDNEFNQPFFPDTRVYLLLRVAFALDESAPAHSFVPSAAGWWYERDAISGNTANLAWPIRWNDGHPIIVSPCKGRESNRYDAVADFRYLYSHVSFR